jgi:hypothetical protein
MGLAFAFLLIFVFTPEKRETYPAYELERREIVSAEDITILGRKEISFAGELEESQEFRSEVRSRSASLMEEAKAASLAVITADSLDRVDGLRDNIMSELDDLKSRLNTEEEKLLSEKRSELEAELSQKLQAIRREIKEKYSDFSQQEIRDNYLKILNLKTAVEVVAENAEERKKYQEELDRVTAAQQELLAEKKQQENMDIAERTQEVIVEFNSEYSEYRQRIRSENQAVISEKEEELLAELDRAREEIRAEMLKRREIEAERIDAKIAETLSKYY